MVYADITFGKDVINIDCPSCFPQIEVLAVGDVSEAVERMFIREEEEDHGGQDHQGPLAASSSSSSGVAGKKRMRGVCSKQCHAQK